MDLDDAATSVAIWVNLIGTEGVSLPKLITEKGWEKGEYFETTISEKELGDIIGITFT